MTISRQPPTTGSAGSNAIERAQEIGGITLQDARAELCRCAVPHVRIGHPVFENVNFGTARTPTQRRQIFLKNCIATRLHVPDTLTVNE